jgi:hypothetical protein
MCLIYHAATIADFAATGDLYTRAMKDAEDFGLGFAVPMLNMFYAQAALACGELEIARKVIGVNAAANAPTSDVTSYGQFKIVTAALAAFEQNRSATIAAALAFRERLIDPELMRGPMNTNGCLMLAQALQQVGATGEAREFLAYARDEPTACTNQFPLLDAHLYFMAAACALDEGNDDEARGHLKTGFEIASVNDFANMILWSRDLCSRLCAEALKLQIEPDYVRRLIGRLRLAPPSLDIENWPWRVQVYALGRFEVLVDGKPLAHGRKRPVRPLELLKYLVAQGRREVPETRIADALWPDLEGDEALNALAINVHRLRRLLGHAEAIVYQGRSIGLNPQCVSSDVAAFERRLEVASAAKGGAEHGALKAAALALYRGDLLPEEETAPWVIPIRDRLRARASDRST